MCVCVYGLTHHPLIYSPVDVQGFAQQPRDSVTGSAGFLIPPSGTLRKGTTGMRLRRGGKLVLAEIWAL